MRQSPRGQMAYYRLYMLSGPDGRFVGFEEIEAPDDAEALRHAARFIGERPLELWCGSRKVQVLAARSPASNAVPRTETPFGRSGRPLPDS